jgi:acetyltransferase-like isoleucine patch superfamily enzyme
MFGDDTNKPVHYGRGRNNHLSYGKNVNLSHSFLLECWGSDCCAAFGNDTHLGKIHIVMAQGASISIGSRSSFEGLYATLYEGGQVRIGEDCMFSNNIQLWQTDTHPIFDMKTGKRINKCRTITIGDHVWMGANAILLGGANIGSGSIVGMSSITSGKIPSNVIVAGNPARIVRENVIWANDQLYLSEINTLSDCQDIVVTKFMEE